MQYVLQAFQTVLQPYNIVVIILATGSGLLMGMLPGLSATMAIALLTGLTYNFPTQSALIALIGVYVGAISGGCQSAILINIPGYLANLPQDAWMSEFVPLVTSEEPEEEVPSSDEFEMGDF